MKLGYNLGSGQRPFHTVPREIEWLNVDAQPRWAPDWCGDAAHTPFAGGEADYVVIQHCLEHHGCNEGDGLLREAHRLLRWGGSLIVSVPNMKALATRWTAGGIDDFIFMVNAYGAYMGDEADRHKWGYTPTTLRDSIMNAAHWSTLCSFSRHNIPGLDFSFDWWILAMEARK